MSVHESSQVAPADIAAQTRADLYLQLQKPEWKDHGRQLQHFLDGQTSHLPSENNTDLALISALLQLYSGEGTGIDPDFDDVILGAIDRMGSIKSPVASHFLNILLQSADLERYRGAVGELMRKGLDIRFRTLTREHAVDAAVLCGDLTDVQNLLFSDSSALALFGADKDGNTPLRLACKNGFIDVAEFLLKLAPEVGFIRDCNGCTAWHISAENGQLSVLETIFKKLVKLNEPEDDTLIDQKTLPRNFDRKWAIHLAAKRGNINLRKPLPTPLYGTGSEDVPITFNETAPFLDAAGRGSTNLCRPLRTPFYGAFLEDVLQSTNTERETPLVCALKKRHAAVAEFLAKLMLRVRFHDAQDRDNLLKWLPNKPENHKVIYRILSKDESAHRCYTPSINMDPLGWAAFSGSAKLVWLLLQNGSPGPSRDDSIKTAIYAAYSVLQGHSGKSAGLAGNLGDWLPDEDVESAVKQLTCSAAGGTLKAYNDVLDMLHNPPATVRPPRESPPEEGPVYSARIHPAAFVNEYRVELVECSNDSFLRRSVSVKEALYDRGPVSIMKSTSQRTRELQAEFSGSEQTDETLRSQDSPKVIWVHLPANNVSPAHSTTGKPKLTQFQMKWHEVSEQQ